MEKLKLFRYCNPKDSNLGSEVIVISSNIEDAKRLIATELSDMGFFFSEEVGTLTELEIINNEVISSFSGDCYF